MIGQDAIGFHAIGEGITGSAAPLIYPPVSRIIASGFVTGRPAEVFVLGVDLVWEYTIVDRELSEFYITWDNGEAIGWEA